jgi:hypothetical protein
LIGVQLEQTAAEAILIFAQLPRPATEGRERHAEHNRQPQDSIHDARTDRERNLKFR